MEKQVIKYKDLSTWLKVAVICMWVTTGYYLLSFIIAVVISITESI